MHIILIVFSLLFVSCNNAYSGDIVSNNCTTYTYKNVSICLDSDYTVESQGEYISISKQSYADKGFVVVGASPGKDYENNVMKTCSDNGQISCISRGYCSISNAKGKMLKYIDRCDPVGMLNVSCFIEEAELVIIYHGLSEGQKIFEEILNNAALQ